jgi:hypothetical protein
MAADVMAGNVQDHERALEPVQQVEANANVAVEEAVGDCAYGDNDTRRTFASAGRKLVAKVPNRRGQAQFPNEDFRIDLETMTCVCPAGQQTRKVVSVSSGESAMALPTPRCVRSASTLPSATLVRYGLHVCERALGKVGW